VSSPFGEMQRVIVERARVRLRQNVSPYVAERFAANVERDGAGFADMLVVDLETELLTEKLPPQRIEHRIGYEHPEAIGRQGFATDSRFARPIDHFTAKYRGRWWGRLIGLRHREIRYQFVKVPYIISAPVRCDHRVTVDVHAAWTYPRADMVLPASEFGMTVLKADSWTSDSVPTVGDALADAVKTHARSRGERW
jgi:hypothetical protein